MQPIYSFSLLSPAPEPVLGCVVFVVLLLPGCCFISIYQGAYITIPRADRLAPYCLSIAYTSPCRAYIPSYCSLITYTHQCTHKSAHRMHIMVLEYVYTCYFCCWLFFCIMLFVMPLLQLSHHQLAISSHLIFVGALPQTEKYVEQVEK